MIGRVLVCGRAKEGERSEPVTRWDGVEGGGRGRGGWTRELTPGNGVSDWKYPFLGGQMVELEHVVVCG
eukprot:9487035-Prorocentrum_lima.AAC.2